MSQLFQQLYWREPLWLLLVLFPLLLMLWRQLQQRHSLRRYADADLHPWVIAPDVQKRRHLLLLSQFLIWLMLGLAAAGPRLLISAPQKYLPPQGAAVVIIDHSRSMLANDVFPDRLQQAHDVVTEWTRSNDDIKLGLIIFAGASHIVLPVTSDKQMLKDTALLLSEIQLPTFGSAIVQSLEQARSLLLKDTGSRAIIMLTDGDVPAEQFKQLAALAEQLQQDDIELLILGVGRTAPIALADTAGHWLQYEGETVVTRLAEIELQALASLPGISYSRLKPGVHDQLINVWHAGQARISAQHYDEVLWQELFPWFLVPALLLIMFNHLSIPRLLLPSIAVLGIVILIQPPSAEAAAMVSGRKDNAELLRQAYASWQDKDYEAAAITYARVDGYLARMGEGSSCYKGHQLDCAITAFSRAAWEADTDEQRGRAAYNLGNSFFQQGDFESAITLFNDALRYQPQQHDYKNNLAFSEEVQRNIERRLQQEADSGKSLLRRGGENEVDVDDERISEMNMRLSDKTDNQLLDGSSEISLSEQQLAYYMQRSRNFARLSSGQDTPARRRHDWSHFSNDNPVAARRVEYWQRLFELEEGIPAHPDEAKILPGVRPW